MVYTVMLRGFLFVCFLINPTTMPWKNSAGKRIIFFIHTL